MQDYYPVIQKKKKKIPLFLEVWLIKPHEWYT